LPIQKKKFENYPKVEFLFRIKYIYIYIYFEEAKMEYINIKGVNSSLSTKCAKRTATVL
jgi:hypothetical protein